MAKKKKDIFELLNNPPAFKVDRNYEQQNRRIEASVARKTNEEEVRRQSLLTDVTNRFILDTENGIIHDRSCSAGKALRGEAFTMTKEYVRGKILCEECRAKALVRQMTAEADHEKQKEIFKILHDAEKRFEDIERLWRKDAILRYITCNTLEIQVGMERWRIERLGKEDFRLLHNSYLIVNYQRYSFTKKFHEQLIQGEPTFHNVVNRILSYDSEYHVQKLSRADECEFNRGLKLAPENELLRPETAEETFLYPIMVRVKGKGIWFDYYTYIDCTRLFAQKAFIRQNIRARQLLELPCGSTDYVLVCCKAPKWQRRWFYSVMEEVKAGLYRHGYQRGFVAMEVVMQFLTAQGIRVA